MSNKYDSILGEYRQMDVHNLSTAPENKNDAYLAVVDGVLYYFSNGHRYKLIATLDDPVGYTPSDGDIFGLWGWLLPRTYTA